MAEHFHLPVGGAAVLVERAFPKLLDDFQAAPLRQKLLPLRIQADLTRLQFQLEGLPVEQGFVPECRERTQVGRGQSLLGGELLLNGEALRRLARQFSLGFRDLQAAVAQFFLLNPTYALLPLQNPLQAKFEAAHGFQSLAAMARSRSHVSGKADFSELAWRRKAVISGCS